MRDISPSARHFDKLSGYSGRMGVRKAAIPQSTQNRNPAQILFAAFHKPLLSKAAYP
ncbi:MULTISPECIES: hypothetical protein [Sphingobium]|uniref:hypothetical protein n=1 Tax=Sphingobium TaxID=165695 RepID=UPI0012E3C594|nr:MULTISPECIES: hypothetical protein [Sphingobium]